jgi:hypothetical protein
VNVPFNDGTVYPSGIAEVIGIHDQASHGVSLTGSISGEWEGAVLNIKQ